VYTFLRNTQLLAREDVVEAATDVKIPPYQFVMLTLQPWMEEMKNSLQSKMDETVSKMDFFDDETSTDVDEGLRTLVDE
jgi:hypothetical protein